MGYGSQNLTVEARGGYGDMSGLWRVWEQVEERQTSKDRVAGSPVGAGGRGIQREAWFW